MEKALLFLAQGCGSGRIHPAPGTWGTLAAFLIALAWAYFGDGMPLWFIIAAGVVGVYICDSGEKQMGAHDPSEIVFDEWIGMWITMWHVPLVLTPLAFILFRIFDISKIGPVGKIQDLPGGLGIMADDVVAGIIGRVILAAVMLVLF